MDQVVCILAACIFLSGPPPITMEPSAHLAVLDLFRSVIPNIIPFGLPEARTTYTLAPRP